MDDTIDRNLEDVSTEDNNTDIETTSEEDDDGSDNNDPKKPRNKIISILLSIKEKLVLFFSTIIIKIVKTNYNELLINLVRWIRNTFISIVKNLKKLYEYKKMGVLFMWRDKEYKLKCEADFSNLKRIREFVGNYAKRSGLISKKVHNTQIVIDEFTTNIIRHAYDNNAKSKPIFISVIRKKSTFEIVIRDYGKQFNWERVLSPDLHEYVEVKRKGGFGVVLIRKLTDKHKYEYLDEQNTSTFRFNFVEDRDRKKAFLDFFSNISRNVSFGIRVGVTGFSCITLIIILMYLTINYIFSKSLETAVIVKGIDSAKSIAANSSYLLDNYDTISMNDLINNTSTEIEGIKYISIVGTNDTIFADTSPDKILTQFEYKDGIEKLTNEEYINEVVETGDEEAFYSIASSITINSIKIGAVHIGISKNSVDVSTRLFAHRVRSIFITIGVWAIGLLLGGIIIVVITSPVKGLINQISKFATKELDLATLQSNTLIQFSDISEAFSNMVYRIKQQEAQLTDQSRIKREMKLAKDIQETLLPKTNPQSEGFEIFGYYKSALEMGGDYYDFFDVSKNLLGIIVADVSGKGIGSAFIMAMCRIAMRTESRNMKRASDVLVKTNDLLLEDIKKGMYITIYYAILDIKKRTLDYASAGHNPMILYRKKEDRLYLLNPNGFAIGIRVRDNLFEKRIKSEKIRLRKDDLVVIYTDGITEAMNPEREEFGEERLINFIRQNADLNAKDFSLKLDEYIDGFSRGYPQSDDITYIVIKVLENFEEKEYSNLLNIFEKAEKEKLNPIEVAKSFGYDEKYFSLVNNEYEENGLDVFKPVNWNTEIHRLCIRQQETFISIIKENPNYGVVRIKHAFASEKYGGEDVSLGSIFRELKRLNILDIKSRKKYIKGNKLRHSNSRTFGISNVLKNNTI